MSFNELKATLSKMTRTQKADYLWTYYKWVLVIAVAVIMVIGIIISCVKNANIEVLYSGAAVNVRITECGETYLTDGWEMVLGGTEEKQRVDFITTYFEREQDSENIEIDSAAAIQITAMVAAQQLDYIIISESELSYYQSAVSSLETIFDLHQLAKYADMTVYLEDETGNAYPAAIDISDCLFTQKNIAAKGKIYIAFPGNTTRTKRNIEFLEYLFDWVETE